MTSAYAIPAILTSPSPDLASQWAFIYNRGVKLVVPLSITSGVIFATLAYQYAGVDSWKSKMYGVAAASVFGFAPYTGGLMLGLNASLQEAAAKGTKEGVVALVERWGTLNLWRGVFPFVGMLVGTWISLGEKI